MPRGPRIDYPGAFHHVMNRGARRQPIFLTDDDRRSFLSLLADAAIEYDLRVLCACLMDNHYHLLVQSPLANLSESMRHIGSVHALRFNEHNGTDGPLFRGRFRSLVVSDDEYLLTAARYIDNNPVVAKLCDDPADHPWSTYRYHAGLAPAPSWLALEPIRSMVGGPDAYRRFVGPGLTPNDLERYRTAARSGILGSTAFAGRVHGDSETEVEARPTALADAIDALVAAHFHVDIGSLALGARGSENTPRLVATALARAFTALTPRDVAQRYGFGSTASVRSALRRHPSLLRAESLAALMAAAADLAAHAEAA